MMRGPVLPQARQTLWSLVAPRLETIERGLVLVAEGLDCSDGTLGSAEGLARDAAGAPVVLLLAVEGDALLPARALGAADFLQRVGDALAAAVPEGAFQAGAVGRVLVIATAATNALESLVRRDAPGVQVCCLEPFRLAQAERFAVRWLVPAGVTAPALMLPEAVQSTWAAVEQLCGRIDESVRVDGDRYRRRVTWNGHVLAECWLADGGLHGAVPDTDARGFALPSDLRPFSDHLLRRYARVAGLTAVRGETQRAGDDMARPERGDGLRAVAAAARLTGAEIEALTRGGVGDDAATADDVVRIVAAQEGASTRQRSD